MSHPGSRQSERRSHITLGVGDEVFAVAVEHVREILDYRAPIRLPGAPPFLLDMIDVRGGAVPVIDLRTRLGLPPAAVGEATRILVLEVPHGDKTLTIGLLTDRVFEVAEIDIGAVEAAPDIGMRWKSDYIRGISRLRDNFVIIFDIAKLFANEAAVLRDALP